MGHDDLGLRGRGLFGLSSQGALRSPNRLIMLPMRLTAARLGGCLLSRSQRLSSPHALTKARFPEEIGALGKTAVSNDGGTG